MPLVVGTPAPVFTAPSPINPKFVFGSYAGRYSLLVFLPPPSPERDAALSDIARRSHLLHDDRLLAFAIVPDAESFAGATQAPDGLRWFLDAEGDVRRLYDAADPQGGVSPVAVAIDPSLRILGYGPLARVGELLDRTAALGAPDDHARTPMHAPVLIVPRVLDPEYCRELISCHEAAGGGQRSGVMREDDGRTVGVIDNFKSRRDANIPLGRLQDLLRESVVRRLLPEIEKAFQFRATRIERYLVACYDAGEGGYFRPHRDNTTPGTAHRKFAVTINLNAEDFAGGDLRFPEFGARTYRAPTGGAVVFSCSLLHEATPVISGRRYATLPFLYDEAGAQIRAANLHTIVDAPLEPTVPNDPSEPPVPLA